MEKLEAVLSLIFGLYSVVKYKSIGEHGVRPWGKTFHGKTRTLEERKRQVAASRAIVFTFGLFIFIHGLIMSYKLFFADTTR